MLEEFIKTNKTLAVCAVLALLAAGLILPNFVQVSKNPTQVDEFLPGGDSPPVEIAGPLYVDISGAVKCPGVYKIPSGSRLVSAIDAAGGLAASAMLDDINLAGILKDGQKVVIASRATTKNSNSQASAVKDSVVNINTGDDKTLDLIPGVGPVMAKRIIDYRTANGNFKNIEDLKNVSGIGDAKLEKLKKFISLD
ncbi:MAG: ComEA family DNA-binding protein [Candidatus Margulisiibacteriota bacterium]